MSCEKVLKKQNCLRWPVPCVLTSWERLDDNGSSFIFIVLIALWKFCTIPPPPLSPAFKQTRKLCFHLEKGRGRVTSWLSSSWGRTGSWEGAGRRTPYRSTESVGLAEETILAEQTQNTPEILSADEDIHCSGLPCNLGRKRRAACCTK